MRSARAHAAEAEQAAGQANERAANARLEEEKLRALLAGRHIRESTKLAELRAYAGTPLYVQDLGLPSELGGNVVEGVAAEQAYSESRDFARSFSLLQIAVGWHFHAIPDPIVAGPEVVGVHVYTLSVGPGGAERSGTDRRAWDAAEALTSYLQSDLGLVTTVHWPELSTNFPTVPLDAVIVTVGTEDLQSEIQLSTQGLP